MEKLSHYLQAAVPGVDLHQAKKIIDAFNKFQVSIEGKYCHICFKKLSIEEALDSKPSDFLHTCYVHKSYGQVYDVAKVREELGITEENIHPIDL